MPTPGPAGKDNAELQQMLDSYNPPSREDQMEVIKAPTDDYIYLMKIVVGFLSELLPFDVTMDEVKYMFGKFNRLNDEMIAAVNEFSSADGQEESSSYYSYLVECFDIIAAAIPEMFTALQQYFVDKSMSEASKMV